ncbi:MAG: aminotransferase class I/II-fold pyridoxal phosphate-dependent enzyme [Candidatus Hydrogenedentes bacterium]|nr:aminotransferase class I/II-fold pyridoxal phosphate-dependent enzyme [Candidatus Hydrogenedentota bacterium]
MRVVITGGGGYLGSCLSRHLLEAGHAVRIFDRFCFGEAAVADLAAHERCEVVTGDIRRLQEWPTLLKDVDAVVHLASLSNDPSCDLNPAMTLDVNVESAIELARHAMAHGVKRLVFGSSCAVYGRGIFDSLDEQSPANPIAAFGESKLLAEKALLQMQGKHFEPVIARTATMFGWSNRMRFDLAINQMVATALRQGRIIVRGGGRQWRPFVHVQDAAEAMRLLLEAPAEAVAGEIFNIGSDAANVQVVDLAKRVAAAITDAKVDVVKDDEDLRSFRVRFRKIADRLDFTCRHSIEAGIEEVRDRLQTSEIEPNDEQFYNVHRMKTLLATPVDEGGEPIAARFVPLSKPFLGAQEENAVLEALRSGWLTSGPHIKAFEQIFSELVEAPLTVATSSCTASLHLCLVDAGVQPGDEVVLSPITWASVGNLVLNMGAKPVFADVEPTTLNMDPDSLRGVVSEKTRVIMPVHMAGHPAKLDEIRSIARDCGAALVEDAAHALGAAYKGKPIGSDAAMACFSFYAIKNITTIEGGAITVQDPERAAHLRRLAANGMAATAWDRYTRSAVAGPSEVVEPGYKYLLNNVNAAMGLEQIKRFDQFMAARRRLAEIYLTALRDVDEIALPTLDPDVDHAWHLFIVRFRLDRLTRTRDELAHDLRRENIGTGIHFYGLHLHQYYREVLGMKPEDLPNATAASRDILSLPLHPQLTEQDVHDVVEALKKVLAHARK